MLKPTCKMSAARIGGFFGPLVLLFLQVCAEEYKKYPLSMPNVKPTFAETYLCTSIRIDPTEEYYVTAFEPNATMDTAHHMLLFGCEEPGSSDEVWNCGEMSVKQPGIPSAPSCTKGSQVVYAWARNAPKLQLPQDVAFKMGGRTPIQYLVLQVHYASVEKLQREGTGDDSGVILYYTKTPQPKTAGVLMLGTGGRIQPKSVEYMETACNIDEDIVIHPFAFRTHTHSLGRVVSGYKVERRRDGDRWVLLGKKDPQLPQMFYPVENDVSISNGDTVAARCTMESSTRDRVTRVGTTNQDEMCNFYIMYWTYSEDPLEQKYCFSPGPPSYYWKMHFNYIPQDASVLDFAEYY